LALFSNLWNPKLNNLLFEPYDFKESPETNNWVNIGFEFSQHYNNPVDTPASNYGDMRWYTPPKTYIRGGVTSQYTPKWIFPSALECGLRDSGVQYQPFEFEKIIVLTDGICGSSCSQFTSKLRYHGKAAIVGQGGIVGQPMESSSFTGGNVQDWIPLVQSMQGLIPGFSQLPTSAKMRYNYREEYLGNEQTPREFQRIVPDARIDDWSAPFLATNDLNAYYNAINLAAAQFNNAVLWPVIPMGGYYTPPPNPVAMASAFSIGFSLIVLLLSIVM